MQKLINDDNRMKMVEELDKVDVQLLNQMIELFEASKDYWEADPDKLMELGPKSGHRCIAITRARAGRDHLLDADLALEFFITLAMAGEYTLSSYMHYFEIDVSRETRRRFWDQFKTILTGVAEEKTHGTRTDAV